MLSADRLKPSDELMGEIVRGIHHAKSPLNIGGFQPAKESQKFYIVNCGEVH